MPLVPNHEFLEGYLAASRADQDRIISDVLLPFEEQLIEQKLAQLDQREAAVAEERAELNSQTGDAWHDGALNENDRDVRRLKDEQTKLKDRLHGTQIDYPDEAEDRITLGSSVSVLNGGKLARLDIVGFAPVHDDTSPDGAAPRSLEAPLVRGIIGRKVGEIIMLQLGPKPREIEIQEIDQTALRMRNGTHGSTD